MIHSHDLDQPLPPQVAGTGHGWLTEYRRWPVYSRPWMRARTRTALVFVACFLAVVVATVLFTTDDTRALGGLVMLVAQIALPLWAGPALAHRVRARQWHERREGWTLLAVLLAVTLVTVGGGHLVSEPVKQAIAEATGAVDAQGKRKAYRMIIGISVADGAAAPPTAPGPGTAPSSTPPLLSPAMLSQALLVFWLAGGLALLAWRRERAGLARLVQQQALERAERQRHEAELRLSVLAAQVEPHFLFNTLAGVRSAITSDPGRAAGMIDRLVEYLRASIPRLRADGTLEATVGAQAEIVRAYLALMQSRMSRLQYTIDVPDALSGARCPPLMLITLAENAIKHGVEPKIGAVQVMLQASSPAPGRLRLAVLDDGVGFAESGSGGGLGLSNVRARLAQLFGDAASLTLRARPGGGVEAAIDLPLEPTAERAA